jgi:dethiobiotin synthetase
VPARAYFIAGTDTGVGKTRVTCALLAALNAAGYPSLGMKPVATGAEGPEDALLSDDVDRILEFSPPLAPRLAMNPYVFRPPVSPDIAAEKAGISIDIARIVTSFELLSGLADFVLVEGTGGWLCPIGPGETMADVAAALGAPVLLVVGLKLGCISHALLTAEAIRSRGCTLAGWIGNRIDPEYQLPEANLASLAHRLDAPPLAVAAHAPHGLAARDPELNALAKRLAHAAQRL